jgi:hypothetical protein
MGLVRQVIFLSTLVVLVSGPAKADIVFPLDQNDCSPGCRVDVPGAVTLRQKGPNTVSVTLNLAPDYAFRALADGNHHTFLFNIPNNWLIMISNGVIAPHNEGALRLSTPSATQDSPFGNFFVDLQCTMCETPTNYVRFDLTSPGLTTSSFTRSASGYYFAADLQGVNASSSKEWTGYAASKGPASPVPENASSAVLLAVALLGLESLRRNCRLRQKDERTSHLP